MDVFLAFVFAFRTFRFLPLKRIQFLKMINTEINANNIQNFVEDIVIIFICFAKAIKKAPKANMMDSSKKLIYANAKLRLRFPKVFL
ncbi:hypothetical protein [Winogradskyella flava]|uniref:hypothetical protein n=1 Tax=Winogradskyella flava TaxID=1884876 RepID=UPI00248FE86E|nr:hypothetical protein [Winogradskyella flava]